MEEAHKEGLVDDASIFSLSEKVRALVPGPSRPLLTRLSELTDSEIETALDKCPLSRFCTNHTCDLILVRGDPADVSDYNRYLQLKDIQCSRFKKMMAEDGDQAMRDATYGPPPLLPNVGVLPLSLPLHAHDIVHLSPQGPYPSLSLMAPNTNV